MKKLFQKLIAIVLLVPLIVLAETPSQVDFLIGGLTDSSGQPLAGGKVYTYSAGTTSNKTCWQDGGKSVAHANPIILDAEGKKLVFCDGNYKFKIDSSTDVTQYTLDNLKFGLYNGAATYAGATTGGSSTYVATLSPPLLALVNGASITFEANHTNTGAATLNVNGLGAIDLNRSDDSAVTSGEILIGVTYTAVYESGTNAWLINKPVPPYGYYGNSTTGSANAYVLTTDVAIPALRNGLQVTFEASFVNTGAATLNVSSLGAVDLNRADDTALLAGDIASGHTYTAVYESGTNAWLILTPTAQVGTYTPTLSNTTNVAASTAFACGYSRVWNQVTVGCLVNVDPTAAAPTATVLGVSLPIASNIQGNDLWGTCAPTASTTERPAGITGDSANDRATLDWATADTANHAMYCNFVYIIH